MSSRITAGAASDSVGCSHRFVRCLIWIDDLLSHTGFQREITSAQSSFLSGTPSSSQTPANENEMQTADICLVPLPHYIWDKPFISHLSRLRDMLDATDISVGRRYLLVPEIQRPPMRMSMPNSTDDLQYSEPFENVPDGTAEEPAHLISQRMPMPSN